MYIPGDAIVDLIIGIIVIIVIIIYNPPKSNSGTTKLIQ